MRLCFSLFFFLTAIVLAFGQTNNPKLDSLKTLVQTTSGDEQSAAYIQLSYQWAGSNVDSAAYALTQAFQSAKSNERKSLFRKSYVLSFSGKG